MVKVFFQRNGIFSQQSQLVDDFKMYKETGIIPDYFGRDVLYDSDITYPSVREAGVKHLHLLEIGKKGKKLRQYNRTSDTHLVYCQGIVNHDYFLLIDILQPDAHQQARDNNVMMRIGNVAKNFRERY